MRFLKIVALVPMRHHSQRVPEKNYREMAGKPLYHHILNTLDDCPEIDKIVVDTDSEIIIEGLRADFPKIMIIERPTALCADNVPMNDILLYDTDQVPADLYLQTHSTNPLLKSETIARAIETFQKSYPENDSLFGVTRYQTRLWDANSEPVNHDPAVLLRTQDLPPLFEENSCIYIFDRETLLNRKNRIGAAPILFDIDPYEALDIDNEIDFTIVECLVEQMRVNIQEPSEE